MYSRVSVEIIIIDRYTFKKNDSYTSLLAKILIILLSIVSTVIDFRGDFPTSDTIQNSVAEREEKAETQSNLKVAHKCC
jgi:hypothetical protein